MRNRFTKERGGRFAFIKTWGISLVFFAGVILVCWQGLSRTDAAAAAEKLETARKAVVQAAVHCYALEGEYPPDMLYLRDHYGLRLDRNYVYHYEAFASNIMPDITVLPRNGPLAEGE
ncbi:MAG: hypothetical protein LBL37_06360 [Gracilibacteraceae bacterium]|jgi:hypothetical protein|nr:hypothetical protein [Gracilibacteraceae bacterium]